MSVAGAETPSKLPVLPLLGDLWRIYARHWRLLVPLALVVMVPQALSEGIDLNVDTHDLDLARTSVSVLSAAALVGSNLAGEALYAGMVTALVVQWGRGELSVSVGTYVRGLPILRLIAADILLGLGTAAGLVLLIVPGILFAVYTLVTTVVIELEDASVLEGIRRSASLVGGSFWRVLMIWLVLIAGTEVATALVVALVHGFAIEAAVHVVIEAVVEPFQGVATVLIALELMEMRGERPSSVTA